MVSAKQLDETILAHKPKVDRVRQRLNGVLLGKAEVIELALTTLLARGHLLIEDVPGVGKTTLAEHLAGCFESCFHRIQFTSDLLPSDVIGIQTYQKSTESFTFNEGPLFSNFVLADEINRASPRTQSALLQAMSDTKVSVDRMTYELPNPFMVIATQNPFHFEGTFPLPESQLDRFSMVIEIGYPPRDAELQLLQKNPAHHSESLPAIMPLNELLEAQACVEMIHCDPSVSEYLLSFIESTRDHASIELGASPRAALSLMRCAKAHAFLRGRSFIVPDDLKLLAVPSLAHRIKMTGAHKELQSARVVIQSILSTLPVPK